MPTFSMGCIVYFLFLLLLSAVGSESIQGLEVLCSHSNMEVRLPYSENLESVKLDKWSAVPGCAFVRSGAHVSISLPLDDDLVCGSTRVKNRFTGDLVYYHRVLIHKKGGISSKFLVKCKVPRASAPGASNVVKRNVLPPEFEEPDYIEITSEVSGQAPIPILNVGVRQNNAIVDGEINVVPGTPLTMEVYLDEESAGTYGILVSYMEVTDSGNKNETIIFNGCSLDPYLFENFRTTDGDLVSAKFRAFKFPESNFVLFRGTVDVCLDKCQGITCSNGQQGFGRRRRNVYSRSVDPNKIFEVTMMTLIKVRKENDEGSSSSSVVLKEASEEASRPSPPQPWSRTDERTLSRTKADESPFIDFNSARHPIGSRFLLVLVGFLQLRRVL